MNQYLWISCVDSPTFPEGVEADPPEIKRLVKRYGKILDKAKEEYGYEPSGDYFKDGYNLYKRMWEDKKD